jgi:DedD protein
MGLLSMLKRKDSSAAPVADAVEQARTRARRRLIGAVVLVGIGIIGFPLVFETQPRPIAVDVPIEIPRKDTAAPLVLPVPRPAASAVGGRDETIAATATDADKAAAPSEPVTGAPPPVAAKPSPSAAQVTSRPATSAAGTRPDKPEKAARTEPEKQDRRAATTDSSRTVVQVGAYADADAAREARQRVEKLGLKTFTQVVETDSGKRIRVRVGPFASRDEADRAAGRLKSAGLPAAVLTP